MKNTGGKLDGRVRDLLESTVVWDNHGCMPLRADERFLGGLSRYLDSGVSMVSLNVGFGDFPWQEHLRVLSFMRRWIALREETFLLISTLDDVHRCRSEGKLGVVFDVEGMSAIEEDLSLVQTFYELGVRWMLIAYNRNNMAGGGCLDNDLGLTAFGRAVIDEMERVGMVLCLSHTGPRTALDALEYARKPPIFSHSNPYGGESHVRNISNEMIRACAEKGGVVGLNGIGAFLGATEGLVGHLLRHIRYVIDLVGPEHVGLGLDYVFDPSELEDHIRRQPSLYPSGLDLRDGRGMIAPESMADIAEGLARDNLTDDQIRGVLGQNWLRIAASVWR